MNINTVKYTFYLPYADIQLIGTLKLKMAANAYL